ncbi:MAG: kynureninase [Saprospiraceae bacterium]|nr:kynureninase [Saprospiraceae bacterium]
MFQNSLSFAQAQDASDPLKKYRADFYIPKHEGKEVIYLCGNSLGLQPKSVGPALEHELAQWRDEGVEGHFRGKYPWMYYHRFLLPQSAKLVGAKESEVVVMNTLTTNLHLLMISFYRPTSTRFKILMEGGAFPSDQYAMETQAKFHGFAPEDAIVELFPRKGEHTLRTADILERIQAEGDQLALIMLGGVNYYTGQFFDLKTITEAGHRVGAKVGFDLAHTVGNLPLHLHEWGPDFAVWCSYKYLNSGPGGPSGIFVHERHGKNPELQRFGGWWGHDESSRFEMRKGFIPMEGAAGWQLSNAQIFSCAAHKASLDIFDEVGMEALRAKSLRLTAYMEWLLRDMVGIQVITPTDPKARGCQLSIVTASPDRRLFDFLSANGVVADWREANKPGEQGGIIRVAPVPLYNSFEDVWHFARLVKEGLAVM